MTKLFLSSVDIEKWLHQNKAEYTGNYREGCLIDNFVVATKRGYAFIYEHYLNSNASNYLIKFIAYKDGYEHNREYDKLWSEWYELENDGSDE